MLLTRPVLRKTCKPFAGISSSSTKVGAPVALDRTVDRYPGHAMTHYFSPVRADDAEPLALDMQSLFLSGRVLPFGANLSVTHVFRSSEKSPVEVIYSFPLPRDASLVSFQISGEGFSISSRLERRSEAEKRYEEALEEGSLAALTRQNADGMVNLAVGNLRPGEIVSVRLELIAGVSLSDSGFRLRFPFTVAPCYHSQMRVSVDRPGVGSIEFPEHVADGVLLPPFHADSSNLHHIGFELQVEPGDAVTEIASASHPVRVVLNDNAAVGVKISPARDVPNRDLVLEVKCELTGGRAWSDVPNGDRKHFAVIAPSTVFGRALPTARRVVFLLDRSGSMSGKPIKQARHALENCLANLSPEDLFGIVAFDTEVEQFRERLVAATPESVEEACTYLNGIDARGGTELASGVDAAAHLLTGSKGEIFVITDGQVSETSQILQRARKCEIRLFCLGIGGASQDRFLALLARQTGGVCRFVTPSERVDAAAFEVFAAVGGSVASRVHVGNANVEPASAGDVFHGTPFVAFGDVERDADSIDVEWAKGARHLSIQPLDSESHGPIRKLQGAKVIADFEASYDRSDAAARQRLYELSERYGLTSSEMSLLAVVKRADDQAGDLSKTKLVPVGMAQDVEFGSYFGRKKLLYGETSRMHPASSGIRFRAAADLDVDAMCATPARSFQSVSIAAEPDLLPLIREAIRIIEYYVLGGKDAEAYVGTLLSTLKLKQNSFAHEAQNKALKILIEFLTDNPDRTKWIGIRRQLEAMWPELGNMDAARVQGGNSNNIRVAAGMQREDVLRIFETSVNQRGTMFSTDHWLQPKLEQLRGLLSDPITEEQASALLDVLYERHWMSDLLNWLQGAPMPWQSFFVLTLYGKAFEDPANHVCQFDLLKELESRQGEAVGG